MFIHYAVITFVLCFIVYLHVTDEYVRMITKGLIKAAIYVIVFCLVVNSFLTVITN